MGNHDVYDTSEDWAIRAEERAFQQEANALRNELMNRSATNFTVGEIWMLFNMPSRKLDVLYTKKDMDRLRELKNKVERLQEGSLPGLL